MAGEWKGRQALGSYTELFDVGIALAGIYMLYGAITGKGSLYKTDNVKKGREQSYRKLVRLFCLPGGLLAVAQGLLDYFGIQPCAMILLILLCAVIVVFCALNMKYRSGRGKEERLK